MRCTANQKYNNYRGLNVNTSHTTARYCSEVTVIVILTDVSVGQLHKSSAPCVQSFCLKCFQDHCKVRL